MRTTAAAAAAGAVALAPMAPGTAAAQAADPVEIRVGSNPEFTRVEFAGVVGARARVRREGRQVVVRIGATAAPDVSRLRVDPPPGVAAVETRAVSGGTELVLTLAEGADARSGVADGAVWLNLYAAAAEAPAPARTVQATTPVSATVAGDRVTLRFGWDRAVGAAVFRRGPAVWVVFDQASRLDMAGARALGPAGEARWAAGPDYVAVRIAAPEGLPVSARPDGSAWLVTVGGAPTATAGIELARGDDGASLQARMAGATRVVWLTDPLAGDRFAAVTALAPGKGLGAARRTVDASLLPTAQGLAVEGWADDLTVVADGDLVTVARPGGLSLSPPSAALEAPEPAKAAAPRKAPHVGLVLAEWAETGHGGFGARHRELQDAAARETIAAGDDPRAPMEARLALARFLVGSGLGYEAVGVLNALVDGAPGLGGEPELRALRGAARAQIGRLEEADADFAAAVLAGEPAVKVWQGYVAARQGRWDDARRLFGAGATVIDQFPAEWRARFGAAHARAALETGDLAAARSLLAYSFSQDAPAADQLEARLIQSRLFELEGQSDRALAVYRAVGRAPLENVATPAMLGQVRVELAKGTLKADGAAKTLEGLRWRWRGDAVELEVIRTLADLYRTQGLYRRALEALRGADKRLSRIKGVEALQADQAAIFRLLFLEGGADGLQPVQALGLFYDFRELTPIGADGDEMVRRLARRLVDVDLLGPAAELLKHQVDTRLDGVAKAQVATDLASVYLMDRQPEAALQAIWTSRTTLLPSALNSERRALEGRALAALGRFDHALEVLGTDQGPDAREVRAEIYWKQEKWGEAAALYDAALGDRFKDTAAPLSPADEGRLVRAGVGYSLARNAQALARLSANYAPFVARARAPAALRIALDGLGGMEGEVSPADFAALTRGADTFAGWVAEEKQAFRARTATNRAAPKADGGRAPAPAPAARPTAPARPAA